MIRRSPIFLTNNIRQRKSYQSSLDAPSSFYIVFARYRLEVTPDVFTLFEQLADDSWFPLYAFPREADTNFPRSLNSKCIELVGTTDKYLDVA